MAMGEPPMNGQFTYYTTGTGANGLQYWDNTQHPVPQLPFYAPPNPITITYPMWPATLPEEKKEPMRGLYEVFIVDPETDTVFWKDEVIANDESSARMKMALRAKLSEDIEKYDLVVRFIGHVRPKSKDSAKVGE